MASNLCSLMDKLDIDGQLYADTVMDYDENTASDQVNIVKTMFTPKTILIEETGQKIRKHLKMNIDKISFDAKDPLFEYIYKDAEYVRVYFDYDGEKYEDIEQVKQSLSYQDYLQKCIEDVELFFKKQFNMIIPRKNLRFKLKHDIYNPISQKYYQSIRINVVGYKIEYFWLNELAMNRVQKGEFLFDQSVYKLNDQLLSINYKGSQYKKQKKDMRCFHPVDQNAVKLIDYDVKDYLCTYTEQNDVVLELKQQIEDDVKSCVSISGYKLEDNFKIENLDGGVLNIEPFKQLINVIPNQYAEDRESWVKAYFCFLNITKGDYDQTLELFLQFSEKCPEKFDQIEVVKFHEQNCRYFNQTDKIIGVGTLIYWAKKNKEDFNEWFKLFKSKSEDCQSVLYSDYEDVKRQFELEYCFLFKHAMYAINEYDADQQANVISLKNAQFLKERLSNFYYRVQVYQSVGCKIVKKPFIDKWIRDENKLTYFEILFQPGKPEFFSGGMHQIKNLFTGFKYAEDRDEWKPVRDDKAKWQDGDITVFEHFIEKLMDNNDEVITCLLKWFAHIIQKPGKRTGSVPVLLGGHGIGKTSLISFFGACLDKYFYEINDNTNQLLGRFSQAQIGTLLIFIKEAGYFDSVEHHNKLKGFITDGKKTCEIKNGPTNYAIQDYSNFIADSNERCPFRIEIGDRRFFTFECSSYLKDKEPEFLTYFCGTWIKKECNIKCFFDYLNGFQLGDFNPLKDMYKSKHKEDNTEISLFKRFVIEIYNNLDRIMSRDFADCTDNQVYCNDGIYYIGRKTIKSLFEDLCKDYIKPGAKYNMVNIEKELEHFTRQGLWEYCQNWKSRPNINKGTKVWAFTKGFIIKFFIQEQVSEREYINPDEDEDDN